MWACHPSFLRKLGSAHKELCLNYWWNFSISYGCTVPHRSDSPDCNECMWRRVPLMSPCFFFSIKHAFPHQHQAFVFALFSPTLGVNHVTRVSDCWWHIPTYQCLCPLPSCPLFQTSLKCKWGHHHVLLLVYGIHVEASRTGTTGKGLILVFLLIPNQQEFSDKWLTLW